MLKPGPRTEALDPTAAFPSRTLLLLLLVFTLALKLFLAWRFEGFLTGDDLEIVQTGAKYALGVRYDPWSLRCLFHPIVLVAPVLKLAALLGTRDPGTLRWVATFPTIAFSTAAIGLTFALARRCGWSRRAAAAGAFFYAFAWLPLAYGATPFPRPISTAMLLAAFYFASDPGDRPGPALSAGILAGAAFGVRWSEGIVLIALCGWAAWRFRSWKKVLLIAAGFGLGTLVFAGITDWLTWGTPLKSLAEFYRIMFLERPDIDHEPIWDYAYTVLHWAGPLLLLLLIPAWKDRQARSAIAVFVSIVGLMSLFKHKEWRYLQAAMPFLALAAGAGFERLRAQGRRFLAASALVLAVPYGLERTVTLLSNGSAAGIEAARFIRSLRPQPRVLAFEQQWAYGEHLYLGNDAEIREVELARPLRSRAIREAAAGADIVGVYARHLDDAGRRQLTELGFRQIGHFKKRRSYECLVFGHGVFAAASDLSGGSSERRSPEALPTHPAPTAPPAPGKP
jgi:hypothetical protein